MQNTITNTENKQLNDSIMNYVAKAIDEHEYPCFEDDDEFKEQIIYAVTKNIVQNIDDNLDNIIDNAIEEYL